MIGAILRKLGSDLSVENINLPNLDYGQVLEDFIFSFFK